jgi:hypothetical protein
MLLLPCCSYPVQCCFPCSLRVARNVCCVCHPACRPQLLPQRQLLHVVAELSVVGVVRVALRVAYAVDVVDVVQPPHPCLHL